MNKLNDLLDEKVVLSEVEACFDDVKEAWKMVEQKHDVYLDAVQEEDLEADEWIQEVQETYVKARRSVLSLQSRLLEEKRCDSARRVFMIQETSFNDICANVDTLIKEECSSETLINERLVLASQFERLRDAHSSYVSVASEDISKEDIQALTIHADRHNFVKASIDKYISSRKKDALLKKTPFRMEKMPLPKFDGTVRSYPQFKKDFCELVLPSVGAKESSYTLRQCLTREVNDYLGGCNTDVAAMIARLDVKYGDPSKIVESIIADIRRFKRPEKDEYDKIVRFIDTLEIGYRDLKQMDLDNELTNANTISIIESKLPKEMQMEWYREMCKEGSSISRHVKKFPDLLKFLCSERNAMEYAMSDLRRCARVSPSPNVNIISTNGESACIIHFWVDNHSTEDCRTFKNLSAENKFNVLKEKSACFGCLRVGHFLNGCESKTKCDASSSCDEFHHPSLHAFVATAVNANTITDDFSHADHVLLPVMKVVTDSKRCKILSCLWDSAADISLITNSKARELRLTGKPAKLSITVAGGRKSIVQSFGYVLHLRDQHQERHTLLVYGIDKIY